MDRTGDFLINSRKQITFATQELPDHACSLCLFQTRFLLKLLPTAATLPSTLCRSHLPPSSISSSNEICFSSSPSFTPSCPSSIKEVHLEEEWLYKMLNKSIRREWSLVWSPSPYWRTQPVAKIVTLIVSRRTCSIITSAMVPTMSACS